MTTLTFTQSNNAMITAFKAYGNEITSEQAIRPTGLDPSVEVRKTLSRHMNRAIQIASKTNNFETLTPKEFDDKKKELQMRGLVIAVFDFKKGRYVNPSLQEFNRIRKRKQTTIALTTTKRAITDGEFGIKVALGSKVLTAAIASGNYVLMQDLVGTINLQLG